jgi:ATP-dependent Clp protease, protease subunit
MNRNDYYLFRAEAAEEPTSAELLIFDAIGNWEDIGEVSAKRFAADLAKLPTSVKRIDIHINSPGGSVFDAQAIYSRLADHRAEKIVYVDGLAASAASIVAMVGHKVYIRANANIMVHLPGGIVIGNADDARKFAAALDSITESMINVYAKKTGLERQEIRDLLAAETWMHPEEAVAKGFADEVRGVVKAAASVGSQKAIFNGVEFDLSRFHNVPAFTATTTERTKPMKQETATATAAAEDPPKDDKKDKDKKKETPPAPAPPLKDETPAASYDDGVKAERARIAALNALDKPATHEIITKAIAEGKTVNDIAAECVEAMSKAQAQSDRRTDASSLDHIPPSDGADDPKAHEFGGRLKSAVKAVLAQRGKRSPMHSRN